MLRISQIKLNPEEPVSLLPKKIGQKLRIRNFQPKNWKIVKESIDAREKPRIRLIYTVDFDVDDEDGLLARASFLRGVSLTKAPDHTYRVPDLSSLSLSEEERPVIAGFGPCGMFAALILAEAGRVPVVLERGRDVGPAGPRCGTLLEYRRVGYRIKRTVRGGRRRYFFRRKADDGN